MLFFARAPAPVVLFFLSFFLMVNTSEREHAFFGHLLLADTTASTKEKKRKTKLSVQGHCPYFVVSDSKVCALCSQAGASKKSFRSAVGESHSALRVPSGTAIEGKIISSAKKGPVIGTAEDAMPVVVVPQGPGGGHSFPRFLQAKEEGAGSADPAITRVPWLRSKPIEHSSVGGAYQDQRGALVVTLAVKRLWPQAIPAASEQFTAP